MVRIGTTIIKCEIKELPKWVKGNTTFLISTI